MEKPRSAGLFFGWMWSVGAGNTEKRERTGVGMVWAWKVAWGHGSIKRAPLCAGDSDMTRQRYWQQGR